MKRPDLHSIPLSQALPPKPGDLVVTMSAGQPWDALLATAYGQGAVVLELDARERPVRAYQRERDGGAS